MWELHKQAKFKLLPNNYIYPNPSNGNFQINIPEKTKTFTIFNSIGQIVFTQNTENMTNTSFSIYENGIYFVQIVTDNKILNEKIIVHK